MKRRRVWRWIALGFAGLLLYAILLLVFMPAEYFARIVNALNNDIALQQASGTLWQGRALLANKRAGAAQIGQIRWNIHTWQLLGGALVADLEFSGGGMEGRGTIQAGLRRYLLQGVSATASAPTLSRFYPAANLAGLSGRLQLTADTLEIGQNDVRGSAELIWSDAASRLVPVEKIGTYRLQMTGQGKQVAFVISTVQGVLRIGGKGEWRLFEDGMLRLSGDISPTSAQPSLEPLLNSIGPVRPDGARAFKFETRLTPIKIPGRF
jgi:general secretion pathway protein N